MWNLFPWLHRKEERKEKTLIRSKRNMIQTAENHIKNFRKQLFSSGLDIRPVEEDGNCLFRAVADQIYGSEDCHEEVRANTCDYMEALADFFSKFIANDRPFSEYVRNMRKDGSWGGNIELQGISLLYHVNIRIHQLGEASFDIVNFDKDNVDWIHLAYHDSEHYSSVRRLRNMFSAAPAKHREVASEDRKRAVEELCRKTNASYQQAFMVLNTTDYDWSRSLEYLGLILNHKKQFLRSNHLNSLERKELKRLENLWKSDGIGEYRRNNFAIDIRVSI
eukprot:jgi/Galph1/4007/GphlegSOOS_G2673.1